MFLILLLLTTLLIFLYFKIKFSYWKKRGLKNPPPLLFFGTTFVENFFRARNLDSEFCSKYGPVFGTYSGTKPIFNTSNPEHIKQVLSQDEIFHSLGTFEFFDNYLSKSLIFKNGNEWKQARQAMSHYFTSSKLKNLMPHYESVANNFLKNLEEIRTKSGSDMVDIRLLTKFYGIDIIFKVILAIDIDSYKQPNAEFVKHSIKLDEINLGQFLFVTILPSKVSKFLKLRAFNITASNSLGDLFKKIVRERIDKGIKFNDLTEQMQQQIKVKNLDLDEDTVIGNVILSFFAGVDNISNTICIIMLLLIENPKVMERLIKEIKNEFAHEITCEKLMGNAYLDAVIKESARLKGIVLGLERTAMEDTKIGEFKIEKGCGVLLMLDMVHHNPDIFSEPFEFKPERFLDKSLANEKYLFNFGAGNKNCIGMRLALIEIKYLLVKILLNYDIYKPTNFKLEENNFRTFSGLKSCSLCFSRVKSNSFL